MARIFLQQGRVPSGGILPDGEIIPSDMIPKKYGATPVPEAVKDLILVDVIDAADVYSPDPQHPVTMQAVGFNLKDTEGKPIHAKVLADIGAFDEVDCVNSCQDAFLLNTVDGQVVPGAKGRIVAGENTAGLKVETDDNGEFLCLLSCAVAKTVWIGCDSTLGGPLLHCQKRDAVTFHHHPSA